MQMIIAIALLIGGTVGMLVGVMTYYHAEADVFEKRPDLARLQDERNWHKRRREVTRAYKSEFPRGRKIRAGWILWIGAMVSFVSGFWVLTEIK